MEIFTDRIARFEFDAYLLRVKNNFEDNLTEKVDAKVEKAEADRCIALGAGVGVLGAGAALAGAVCPICIVVAPALIGAGLARRWKIKKNERSNSHE